MQRLFRGRPAEAGRRVHIADDDIAQCAHVAEQDPEPAVGFRNVALFVEPEDGVLDPIEEGPYPLVRLDEPGFVLLDRYAHPVEFGREFPDLAGRSPGDDDVPGGGPVLELCDRLVKGHDGFDHEPADKDVEGQDREQHDDDRDRDVDNGEVPHFLLKRGGRQGDPHEADRGRRGIFKSLEEDRAVKVIAVGSPDLERR